ncbi:unnamed protein product [Cunninghamella blakesleeana]
MSVNSWTLKVKSLEQRTHSVTIASDASVQQLKEAIQVVFDIASHCQRLIFQGKVLKDGTQLAEYANLCDGKVIHLVVRPLNTPSNPSNDDPEFQSQRFGSLFSPPEGYTVVTVDANISGLTDSTSFLNSLFNGLIGGNNGDNNGRGRGNIRTRRAVFSLDRNNMNDTESNNNNNSNQNDNNRNNPSINNNAIPSFRNLVSRHPFDLMPNRLNTDLSPTIERNIITVEDRLTRTLIAISNVMASLDAPPSEAVLRHPSWSIMANATPEQNQSTRARIRASGSNDRAQIGMVLIELTNAMETLTPRLRELAQSLQSQEQPLSSDLQQRLHHMNTIIQTFSMIYHYIGGIITQESSSRRSRGNNRRSSPLGNGNTQRSSTVLSTDKRKKESSSSKESKKYTTETSPSSSSSTTTPTVLPIKRKASISDIEPPSPSSSSSSSSSKNEIDKKQKSIDSSIDKGKGKDSI